MHDFCSSLCKVLKKRTIKYFQIDLVEHCQSVLLFVYQIFKQCIFQQTVHFGMNITGIFLRLRFQIVCTLLNVGHITFQFLKLLVSHQQFLLLVCQFVLYNGQFIFKFSNCFLQCFRICFSFKNLLLQVSKLCLLFSLLPK